MAEIKMQKLDFKKAEKALFNAPVGDFTELDIPVRRYLMIDGYGDPNVGSAYMQALEALYTTAYTLKFDSKKTLDTDYVVPPPESLWWTEDGPGIRQCAKDDWLWTAMIMVPDFLPDAMVATAKIQAAQKKSLPALEKLRLETLAEHHVVQTLFIGPYCDEGPVLQKMHKDYIPAHGLVVSGKHHEIYLSDPRKTAPEKCRTLLRQPVRPE